MSFERTKIRLDQVSEIRSGKRLPLGHTLVGYRTPFPYIRLVDVKNGSIQHTDLKFLAPETRNCIQRYVVNSGDVCLAIVGHTIGMVFYVQDEWNDANLTENAARLTNVKDAVNSKYLYYYLSSEIGQAEILSRKVGSAQGKLPLYNIRSLEVDLPPRREQNYVVELLDALESQIDNLKVTNATLEAIAQALFKSWFVDFDPVRAKLEGRTPECMDEATAALFPDGFEESELGLVPRGWRFSTVGESFVLTMGQSPPGDTYSTDDNGLPFYQGRTDFGFRFPTKRMYCSAPTRIAEIGDTLVSVRAPVGDVNMAIEKCCIGRGVASVRHPTGYRSFTFYAMRGLGQRFENFDSEGTIFGSINKKDFQALPVTSPTLSVLAAYDEAASPIDARIVENEEQIRTLATLRDTLLPRLISGQLRLPDAELQIQKAAI